MDTQPVEMVPPVTASASVWRRAWASVPVRLLQYGALLLLVLFLAAAGTFSLARSLGPVFHIDFTHDELWELLLVELALVPAALIPFWLLTRRTDRGGGLAASFAPAGAGREAAAGFAVGTAFIAAALGAEALLGWYRVLGWNSRPYAGVILVLTLCVGIVEETVFRGFVFQEVEARRGTRAAVLTSMALFGLMHIPNYPSLRLGLVGALSIGLCGGLPLAASYLLTRRLWMPVACHWASDLWSLLLLTNDLGQHGLVQVAPAPPAGDLTARLVLRAVLESALGLLLLRAAIRRGQWRAYLPLASALSHQATAAD